MEEQQLKKFLTVFSTQQQQFFKRFIPDQSKYSSMQNLTTEAIQVNPILLQSFEYFDAKKEHITYYIHHLKNYLKMKIIFF